MFIRDYELIIGSPEKTFSVSPSFVDGTQASPVASEAPFVGPSATPLLSSNTPAQIKYRDYRTIPAGEMVTVITELHIEADISYSSRSKDIKGQTGKISVYNLSKKSRETIQKDGIVFLKAGYQTEDGFVGIDKEGGVDEERSKKADIPLIFCGQIEKVTTTKNGSDMVTEILCKDLGFPARNLRVSERFEPLTSMKEVLERLAALAARNGIPTGFINIPATSSQQVSPSMLAAVATPLFRGLTVEGNLLEQIFEISSSVGLQAYIAAGQLFIEPKGNVSRVEIVSLPLGNIKSIQQEEDTAGETTPSQTQVAGIKVVTFLNGALAVNKMLRIEAGDWQGIYKVVETNHKLSYEGSSWDTEVVATRVSN